MGFNSCIYLSHAANFPSDSTPQWWPFHWEPRDSGYIQPDHCMVPLQPPRLQDRREPAPPRCRGGPRPRIALGGPLRQGRPLEEHRVCRSSRITGRRRPGCDPEHLLDNVWDRLIQWRRALDRTIANLDREEEGARSVADCGWVGQVHRWVLLRRDLRGHLGLLPPLRAQPSLLCEVNSYRRKWWNWRVMSVYLNPLGRNGIDEISCHLALYKPEFPWTMSKNVHS